MLNCEYCDYYSTAVLKGQGKGRCSFTGFIFYASVQELEIEYPCSTAEVRVQAEPAKVGELDWRYVYNNKHVKKSSRGRGNTAA